MLATYMNTFLSMLQTASTIAIVGHINPDGDCVGSCLGLYNYIIEHVHPKKVQVYLEPFSKDFMFLNGASDVCHESTSDDTYELCISLDCGDEQRQGAFGKYFRTAQKTICVDHHVSNEGFGDFCIVNTHASSASEALYQLLETDQLSKECAEALYLGIVHDTGVFKHNCTTKETMEIAGALIACGARPDYIIDNTFYKKTYVQNLLLGRALEHAELYLDGSVIATCLFTEDFDELHAAKLDTDGIVDQLRVTEGVWAAIFAYQTDADTFKFSLRSNGKINVSEIACSYGGGGHVRAAGVSVKASYEETLAKILVRMKRMLETA